MNEVLLWACQIMLALLFLPAAVMKLTLSKQQLINKGMIKDQDNVKPWRLLGLLEALGVAGIILPQLLGIQTYLTSVTAICFALVLLPAIVVHYNKKELKVIPMLVIGLVLCGIIIWAR